MNEEDFCHLKKMAIEEICGNYRVALHTWFGQKGHLDTVHSTVCSSAGSNRHLIRFHFCPGD